MSVKQYSRQAKLFKLLSHPTLLQILDVLRRGDACVCHLQNLLNRPQPYVLQQLCALRNAGLTDTYKHGTFVYYRLHSETARRILEAILGPAPKSTVVADCTCTSCQPNKEPNRGASTEPRIEVAT